MKTTSTLLLACALALPTVARGQYAFTANAGTDTNWTNPANWKLGALDPAPDFPDEGAAAEIAFGPVTMDKEIFLSTLSVNLNTSRPIFLSGNALDCATLNVQSGRFVGGPIDTGTLNVTGEMQLEGAALDFTSATLAGNLRLEGLTTVRNFGGLTITSNAEIASIGGLNQLENHGTLHKSGGGGFSDINPIFSNDGGTVRATSGTLRFGPLASVDFKSGTVESTSRVLFAGSTTLGTVAFKVNNDGIIDFDGPTTITGPLTSTAFGLADESRVRFSGTVTGSPDARLDFSPAAAAVLTNGSQSPLQPITNVGSFIWTSGGTLTNFINEAAENRPMRITDQFSNGFGSPLLAGVFQNKGHLHHEKLFISLGTDALFANLPGAIYQAELGGILRDGGLPNGSQFLNQGTFLRDIDAASGGAFFSITAPFINSDTGRVVVRGGTLTLEVENSIGGRYVVDRSTNPAALLRFGQLSTGTHAAGDAVFECAAGGIARFHSGSFFLKGELSSEGSEANPGGEVRIANVDMIAEDGETAVFNFDAAVPGKVGDASTGIFARLRPAGSLINTGRLDIERGEVRGGSAFLNDSQGEILIDGILRIGSEAADAGNVSNNGQIVFASGSGKQILFTANSTLLNNEEGGSGGETSRGLIVLGSGTALGATAPQTANQRFINKGDLIAPVGATITALFEQDGANNPTTTVRTGTLVIDRDANVVNGSLISLYENNAPTNSASRIHFKQETVLGDDVSHILENGGTVHYEPASGRVVTLNGTLRASGEGRVRFSGSGLLKGGDGPFASGFNCLGDTHFRFEGGTIGEIAAALSNAGNFIQTGGTLRGDFSNGGDYTLEGSGIINAAFLNAATFNWKRGQLLLPFTNGLAASPETGILNIGDSGGSRTLGTGVTLTNWNEVNHSTNITLNGSSEILIHRGEWTLMPGAGFVASPSNGNQLIRIISGASFIVGGGEGSASSFFFDRWEQTGGHVAALDRNLTITPNQPVFENARFTVNPARTLRFNLPSETDTPEIGDSQINGRLEIISGGVPALVRLAASSRITGSGTVRAGLDQQGTLAPGNSIGTLTLEAPLSQAATAVTEIELAVTATSDRLRVISPVASALGGTLRVSLLNGFAPAPGDTFHILHTDIAPNGNFTTLDLPAPTHEGESYQLTTAPDGVHLAYTSEGTTYDDWAAGHFTPEQLADSAISGPDADPDRDGIANLFEFILDTDPHTANPPGSPGIRFHLRDINGNRHAEYEIDAAPGRAGYQLDVITETTLPIAPASPAMAIDTTHDPITHVRRLTSANPATGTRAFYQLRASLR